jgi:serine/threonine-protein kinase HipA
MKALNIYLHEQLAGTLEADEYGTLIFEYKETYRSNKNAQALSASLPLNQNKYYGMEAHSFFTGLLPEENELTEIAQVLGTDRNNTFRLLNELGKETIGAIRIGDTAKGEKPSYKKISKTALQKLLAEKKSLNAHLFKEKNMRLSLAGAQKKLALYHEGDNFFIPQFGASSNLIIKPPSDRFEYLVENEYLTMQLAKRVGIQTAEASLLQFDSFNVYSVQRFDRISLHQDIHRLHQEDFCQAAGNMPAKKYEPDGGLGFADSIQLIRKTSRVPTADILKFVDLFIFNLLIGNRDAHSKNYSFLYENKNTHLSPAYDLVCTAIYPALADTMAMAVNGQYDDEFIVKKDFEVEAQKANISPRLLLERTKDLKQKIIQELDELENNCNVDPDFFNAYKEFILKRLTSLRF